MLTSFSLGLKKVTKDKTVSRIITECFSLGLKEALSTPPTDSILVRAFSIGLGEGTPTDVRIYRHLK